MVARFLRVLFPTVVALISLVMAYRAPLIVEAKAKHTASVFLLHGLGDSGHGWGAVAQGLQPSLPHIKWILPHAPSMPVTLNNGYRMPAWYDIYDLNDKTHEDEEGILKTCNFVNELIEKEITAGIPSSRIVLGGFSQGGAISLYCGLTTKYKLGAIVGLSTYLPLKKKFASDLGPSKDSPVFMCHGDSDAVVAHKWGKMSAEAVESAGVKVTFKTYAGMGHSSCDQELADLVAFLKSVLPPQ